MFCWATSGFITACVWKYALDYQYGSLNALLVQALGSREEDLLFAARWAYQYSAGDSLPIIQVPPAGKLIPSRGNSVQPFLRLDTSMRLKSPPLILSPIFMSAPFSRA